MRALHPAGLIGSSCWYFSAASIYHLRSAVSFFFIIYVLFVSYICFFSNAFHFQSPRPPRPNLLTHTYTHTYTHTHALLSPCLFMKPSHPPYTRSDSPPPGASSQFTSLFQSPCNDFITLSYLLLPRLLACMWSPLFATPTHTLYFTTRNLDSIFIYIYIHIFGFRHAHCSCVTVLDHSEHLSLGSRSITSCVRACVRPRRERSAAVAPCSRQVLNRRASGDRLKLRFLPKFHHITPPPHTYIHHPPSYWVYYSTLRHQPDIKTSSSAQRLSTRTHINFNVLQKEGFSSSLQSFLYITPSPMSLSACDQLRKRRLNDTPKNYTSSLANETSVLCRASISLPANSSCCLKKKKQSARRAHHDTRIK